MLRGFNKHEALIRWVDVKHNGLMVICLSERALNEYIQSSSLVRVLDGSGADKFILNMCDSHICASYKNESSPTHANIMPRTSFSLVVMPIISDI